VTGLTRRQFVAAVAAAGGGLLLGYRVEATPSTFAPNAFIRVAPDGRVTLVMPQVEMGQGTYTSMPMLLAEELEVEPEQIRLEHAPADDTLYANQFFGEQITGASSSVRAFFEPLRRAGATARTMLVAAAATSWDAAPASCRAHRGVVTHTPTGRTLSYGELAARAATMPVPDKVVLKEPKDFTLIGTPVRRLDSASKVNGTAQFGIDVRLPGMLVATVAASPVLGGKVASIEEEQAKAVPGVRQIVRLDDLVAVVADHMWAAKQGLAALRIRWDDGPNGTVNSAEVVRGLAQASQTAGVTARNDGDSAKALAGAAKTIAAIYEAPFLAHTTMEPINCTVHVRKDTCEVWTGCQVLSRAQAAAAAASGLPREKVVVHNHLLGGGFGRRLEVDYVTQAVRIAKQIDAPVKVVWSREEDVQHDVYRPYYYDRIRAGLDASGKPVAWTHRIVGPAIIARYLPSAFTNGLDIDAVDGAAQLVYDIPSVRVEHVRHEEPVVATGFWRGVGVTHNTFVVESFVDELAVASKRDPVAFRRALLGKSPRAIAVLDLAVKEAGWRSSLPRGRGRGVALLYSSWDTYLAQVAEVETTRSGEVHVRRIVCAVDCGTVVNPDIVRAQIESGVVYGISAALWGEVTIKGGRVEQSNFHDYRALRMSEAPPIEVHLVRSSAAPGGIGEPGTAVTAPALANAIYAATGKRLRTLPLQPALARAARGRTS
jgi:isoquinoline 1-oxidoreductase subunit beta